MFHAHRSDLDPLDTDVMEVRPDRMESTAQDAREASVDPDEGALAVLQVDHLDVPIQKTRLHDHFEVAVIEPGFTDLHDVDPFPAMKLANPVPTRSEDLAEIAVAKTETPLEGADQVPT